VNIVVGMKQIPDLQQIRIRNREPVFEDVPLTFGNLDKNALEAGVELKEAVDGKVVVISAGNEELQDTIKEALAGGADEACIVADDKLEGIESAASAQVLAALIQRIENVGLILFGEGSGDNYSGQVGSRVAEILGLPQICYACKVEVTGKTARITRALEDCEELLEVELPVVVTVVASINEPRIPSVIQILKAAKKPKEILELDELNLTGNKEILTKSNLSPVMERKLLETKTVEELVNALEAEGLIGRC
jgi:electron transfer flavoprotein beta subunit